MWKIGKFYKKSGKPGIVRELSIILIKVKENKLFSQHIIGLVVVRRVIALFVVSKFDLYY